MKDQAIETELRNENRILGNLKKGPVGCLRQLDSNLIGRKLGPALELQWMRPSRIGYQIGQSARHEHRA